MIGAALCRRLTGHGQHFLELSRIHTSTSKKRVHWNPEEQLIDAERLQQVDSVVHLAGEPVGQRWSYNVRNRIRGSRVEGTRLLCETLASNHPPPKTLVSASADKTVKTWSLPSLNSMQVFEDQSDVVAALALSPDGRTLHVGRMDGSRESFSIKQRNTPKTIARKEGPKPTLKPNGATRHQV